MSLSQLNWHCRPVRTTAEARNLVSLQHDPCIVCGRACKLYPVGPVTVERFGLSQSGDIVSFGPPQRFESFHGFRVCARHKAHVGESARYLGGDSEQFNRFIVEVWP